MQLLEDLAHVLAHRQLFARDLVALHQLGPLHDVAPGGLQFADFHIRKARLQALLDIDRGLEEVAPISGQLPQLLGGQLHLLVFQQAAHQLGARVFGFLAVLLLLGRQQHARFDLDEHGGHQQVFGRQLQIAATHLIDIGHVLARDVQHGNVEDVEVLLADQIEQQVQWAFKGFEEDFQRFRRDIQILR